MKSLITLCLLLVAALPARAALAPPATVVPTEISAKDLSREAVEQKIGRKLKFKERVALALARGKMKRAERRGSRPQAGGPTDGFAIASLVCGILGLFLLFTAIPALVFGIISLGRINRDPQYLRGKGMAIAGIILGGLGVLALFIILLIVAAFAGGF